MKLFVALAVVLAILAFTQAQADSEQPNASDPDVAVFDPERPEGSERPLRPVRPGRRPHIRRPRPNEDQPADNENQEYDSPQGRPLRRQVFFDINFDFGKENNISGRSETNNVAQTGA